MPRIKYDDFVKTLRKADFFSFKIVESRMGRSYAKVFISNLLKKGEIIELKKGWYSFKKSPYLLVNLLVKAYLGLGSAALVHGAWDKAVNITILTPLAGVTVRCGERLIGDYKVIVRRISNKMYFGYEYIAVDENFVKVSDPEKTLIDMIYFNYPFIDEISGNLLQICDREKIGEYLLTMDRAGVKGVKQIKRRIEELIT